MAWLIVGDDALAEAEEVRQRPVAGRTVPFQRQIGAIELQQEAVRDDRLVFHPQRLAERGEIGFLRIVVPVLHDGADDARARARS